MERSPPSHRDTAIKSSTRWLKAKAQDDDCGQLWRVHDDLYDLSLFMAKHPGGPAWIDLTRGQDITEAVETMHYAGIPPKLLAKYWVRRAEGPRRYRYTFQPGGFYRSLKRRAEPVLREIGTGPDWRARWIQDCLTGSFLVLFLLLCLHPSPLLALVTGLFLGLSSSAAHNWFHQADSKAWRRFYFDLSCLSHQEWRISHALSHHLHTNSLTDVEVTAVEPFLSFLPVAKTKIQLQLSVPLLHIFSYIATPFQLLFRLYLVAMGEQRLLPESLLPLLQLILLLLWVPLHQAVWLWLLCHSTAGYWLVITSVTTTHHHPSLWHAGDQPRKDSDWGLHQLDTVRDVQKDHLPVVMTTFGNHLLHHLFPAVDHSKLPSLYPALWETCRQFGETYPFETVPNMVGGCHAQLVREKPRTN